VFKRAFGRADYGFFEYIRDHLPEWRQAHILSIGCGDGAFERELVRRGLVRELTGIDVARARIEAAIKNSGGLSQSLHFECRDLDKGELGTDQFDGAFAKSSLHHITGLEALETSLRAHLKHHAKLLAIDFFGPSRFQWTDLQLELTNRFISQCPDQSLFGVENTLTSESRTRPSIEAMISMDPSEAVRSSELKGWFEKNFSILDSRCLGGTLLNLIFYGSCVNQFEPDFAEHESIIEAAFEQESALIDAGIIPSDFMLYLGRFRY
jgi:SAM-dependent methyltransferase